MARDDMLEPTRQAIPHAVVAVLRNGATAEIS